jgi:hypothetical protein
MRSSDRVRGWQRDGASEAEGAEAEPARDAHMERLHRLILHANRYHTRHAELVEEFNRLTGNACASAAGVSFRLVRSWQSRHGCAVDGLVGAETLAAARKAGGDGGAAEAGDEGEAATAAHAPKAAAAAADAAEVRAQAGEAHEPALLVKAEADVAAGGADHEGAIVTPTPVETRAKHPMELTGPKVETGAAKAEEGASGEAEGAAPPVEVPATTSSAPSIVEMARAAMSGATALAAASAAHGVHEAAPDAAEAKGLGDLAADDAAVHAEEAEPAKPKKDEPKKTKGDSGGAKKTSGPKDLVETYGTVEEAEHLQESVEVYWVDGLKTEKHGKKTEKIAEEVDNVDQLEMKSQKIPVHKKVAPMFREIFQEILAAGDWKNILERPWAHTPRQNRNNATEWSIHSWGTAMDVNPTTNPNVGQLEASQKKNYKASDRQQKIAKYFTARNFTWLEDSDAMHFQLHSGGAPKFTDDDIEQIRTGKFTGSTSKKQLSSDVRTNIKARTRKRDAAQKKLDAAQNAKTPPSAKKLAALEQEVKAHQWWLDQLNAILVKLGEEPVGGKTAATKADAGAAQESDGAGG